MGTFNQLIGLPDLSSWVRRSAQDGARGASQHSRLDPRFTDRPITETLDEVGAGTNYLGDGFHHFYAPVMQADAIVGCVPRPQDAFADEALIERSPLLFAVVVRGVGPREERQAVGDSSQLGPKRICGPSNVPAQRPCRNARQYYPALPALPQDLVQLMKAPKGQQVGRAAPHYPDQVLRTEVRRHVGDVRHREQVEAGHEDCPVVIGGVKGGVPVSLVSARSPDETDPGQRSWMGQLEGEVEERAGTDRRPLTA